MKPGFRKSAVAIALGAAFALPSLQAEAGVAFKNEGTGPVVNIDKYNFDAGNFLFNDIAPTVSAPAENSFVFMGQTTIANFKAGITSYSASTGKEYTVVFYAPMAASLSGSPVVMNASLAAGTNFFKIFYDDLDNNPQLGTGFVDGTEILSGTIVSVSSMTVTNNSSGTSPKPLQLLDDRPGAPAGGGLLKYTTTSDASFPLRSYTDTGGSPGGGAGGQHVVTIDSKGSATMSIHVDSSDISFFPGAPTYITAQFALTSNPQFVSPFDSTPPSTSFTELNTLAGGGALTPFFGGDTQGGTLPALPGVGPSTNVTSGMPSAATLAGFTVNNFRCNNDPAVDADSGDTTNKPCDFLVQGAGSGSLSAVFIP
jgi:hypothetical protein